MFKNFKSVSMLLLLGGISSSGTAYAVPVSGASGTNCSKAVFVGVW